MPPKNKTPSIDTLGERESLPKSAALGGTAACLAEIARLTAERDEARRDAERWQADALRLLKERNA